MRHLVFVVALMCVSCMEVEHSGEVDVRHDIYSYHNIDHNININDKVEIDATVAVELTEGAAVDVSHRVTNGAIIVIEEIDKGGL